MAVAPTPAEIFERAATEGERRLGQSLLELVATSFIAGFTIVFGMVALGLVEANLRSLSEGLAHVAGALAFGTGVAFLIVGRSELFTENFFDPVASLAKDPTLETARSLVRLWVVTLALNLVGGGLLVAVLSVDGAIPTGAAETLSTVGEEYVRRAPVAAFAKAIVGGALVSLLSFLLQGVETVRSRITLAYIVGFLLALGPFDHVVVTVLHILFGMFLGTPVPVVALATTAAVLTGGNLVGGIGLVSLTHVAQVIGAEGGEA